jgi:hypothetical protein
MGHMDEKELEPENEEAHRLIGFYTRDQFFRDLKKVVNAKRPSADQAESVDQSESKKP